MAAAADLTGSTFRKEIVMSHNFYFGKHADVVAGSANFASLIATGFASYGLTSAQSTAFGTLNTALQSAYSAAVNPPTRTPVTVEALGVALRAMRVSAINLAKIVYSTTTVNDSQLVALGLLPRSARTPIPRPDSAPVIDILTAVGNTVTIRLHAGGDSSSRGKPAGVDGAAIYSFVGATPPTDEAAWKFEGLASKVNKVPIAFPGTVEPGSQVWFTAFWFNERKQNGPAATKVTTNLPGGAAMAA
jgi:hypothetical protein